MTEAIAQPPLPDNDFIMSMEFADFKTQLINFAWNQYPNEACGLFVDVQGELMFVPCQNIHSSPKTDFAISASEYAHASANCEVVAIFHSHTDASVYNGKLAFSEFDKVACEASNLPWVLMVLPQGNLEITHPSGYCPPLLGREFRYGILDCYTLIRDAFFEIGIVLKDYPRGEIGEWNTNPDWNFYEQNFANEGFIEIPVTEKLQKHDVLLMRINSSKLNHAGLMWEPDKNIFYHHLIDRLSDAAIYGGYWKPAKIVRHKSLFSYEE